MRYIHMTVTQYARHVGVDRTTVHRWIREGKLQQVEVAKGVKRILVKEGE